MLKVELWLSLIENPEGVHVPLLKIRNNNGNSRGTVFTRRVLGMYIQKMWRPLFTISLYGFETVSLYNRPL
jgi:hypothetical protein